MQPTAKRVLLGVAISLIVIGAVMGALWNPIFDNILNTQLELTKSSKSFGLWKETPIPMYIEFYMFNVTNHEDVLAGKAKPNLAELGPYVFSEEHTKVNMTWNENQTITFNQIRRWHFQANKSEGSLEDKITNLNTMSLVVAYMGRKFSPAMQQLLNIFLGVEGSVFITKSVGELLFDGYYDKIIHWLQKFENLTHIHIPFNKFGWFYMRNGSSSYDGVFNMFTGPGDMELLGKVHSWNYYTQVPYYDGPCACVNGTAGELWPPKETGSEITMFVSDLCRSMTLDYEEENSVYGVTGRKFTAGKKVIANGTENPENKCFTREKSYPSGVFDVSACKFGAPAYISYPNFYLADPYYVEEIVGMKPEKDKHEFQITLEPETGIPLNVSARLQINLHMQRMPYITMYKSVADVFMPMLWFNEKAVLTEDLADEMKVLLIVPTAGMGIFFGLLGLGVFLLLLYVLITLRGNWKGTEGTRLLKNGSQPS